jgi:hypothetical protein
MQIQSVPSAPSTPAVLAATTPAQIPLAQAAYTSPAPQVHAAQPAPLSPTASHTPAVPAHVAQAAPAVSTASHVPAYPIPSAPPAQPAQTAASSTKTAVPHSPVPTASHAPGSVAPPAVDEAIPAVADSTDAPTPVEARLAIENERLWAKHVAAQATFDKNNDEHTKTQGTFRKSRAELKELRNRLSKLLHELKPLISRPGRGGGWSSFLTKKQIPRATGDSLVRAYQKMLNSEEKSCTTEQITEQPVTERPETVISRYFQGLWPRLSQVVKSPEQVEMFIAVLRETAEKSFAANGESPTSRE